MPRNMSFSMTTPQFIARTKTVTRRRGWWDLKPGDVLCGVEKGMGLKKGEKVNRLGLIEVVSASPEPLCHIYDHDDDCAKEGFPDWEPHEFIDFFMKSHKCGCADTVNRIEFRYLDSVTDRQTLDK